MSFAIHRLHPVIAALVIFTGAAKAAIFTGPYAVSNGDNRTFGPYDLKAIYNSNGKPDGLYLAIGGAMNSGCSCTISVTVPGKGTYSRTATQWQGAAIAFRGIRVRASDNVTVADVVGYQSAGAWNFSTTGGNSQSAAIKAGQYASSQAAGSIVFANDAPITNISVRVTMVVTSGPVGANSTYLGDAWENPNNTTPPKPKGNVYPNKDYQRYPYGVVIYWRGNASFAYRGSWSWNGFANSNQVFRNPNSGKWGNAQNQSGQWAQGPNNGFYGIWARLEGLNANGNWPNLGTCDTNLYVPTQWANEFATNDQASEAVEGKARTRRDVPVTLTTGIGGITVGSSDPGEQSYAVLMTANNRAKEFEVSYSGVVLSADTSNWWSWGVPNWANGYYYGWPVNNVVSLQINPDTSLSGFLNGATTVTSRTALKAIRTTGSYENAYNPSTAYEIGSRDSLEIMPLASGSITMGNYGSSAFTQGQDITFGTTVDNSNVNVSATISDQYPYGYAVLAVGPADGTSVPLQIGSNYPARANSITGNLQSYLQGKSDGYYWLYLIGYTPVDRNDLGTIIDDRTVISFNGVAANPVGGSDFAVPSLGTFSYGWVKLAALRFYFTGAVDVRGSIITDK